MSSALLGSVSAAVASIVAATLAWFQAVKSKRIEAASAERIKLLEIQAQEIARTTELEVEKWRLEASNALQAYSVAATTSAPAREILEAAWRHLQGVRDGLREILTDRSLAREDWLDIVSSISAHCSFFRSMYAERGIVLPQSLRNVAHEVKNVLLALENFIDEINSNFSQSPDADVRSVISRTVANRLTNIRKRLRDAQEVIARARDDLTKDEVNRLIAALRTTGDE